MLSETDAKEILSPYHQEIADIVLSAWNKWLIAKKFLAPNAYPRDRASTVYSFFKEEAVDRFCGNPNVSILLGDQNFRLLFEDRIVIRFKKVDGNYNSRNIPTQMSLQFDRQETIPGLPERTNLKVGYRLDSSETQIEEVVVIYPTSENSLAWCYGVDSSQESSLLEIPLTPSPAQDEAIVARLKDGVRKEKKQGKQ